MDDERDGPNTQRGTDSRATRRVLMRLVTGGLLIMLAGGERDTAHAKSRRRGHRKRHTRRQGTTNPSDPLACDATATSGIAGLVLIGPMCPVETVDQPCPDQPFVADLVVRDAQGQEICTTSSGTDGRFRMGLPPGTYELDPQSGAAGGLPYAAAQWVTVEPDRYTEVTVTFDSGIR